MFFSKSSSRKVLIRANSLYAYTITVDYIQNILQWHHMSLMTPQSNDNSIVSSTVCSDQQETIKLRVAGLCE